MKPRVRGLRRQALPSVLAGLAGLALTVLGAASAIAQAAAPAIEPLSANDVSILFPVPKSQGDLANLIALSDLSGPSASPNKSRLWSDTDFKRFLEIAAGEAGIVAGGPNRIKIPDEVKQIDAWFIAGIRFDAGAPGLSAAIVEQFGRQPQVRFTAQPVTKNANGTVKVHDITAHLIFSFGAIAPNLPNCLPKLVPDDAGFKNVVRDIVALRDQLKNGDFNRAKVKTAGPLDVHPGLKGTTAVPFRNALKALLEKHLAPQRIFTMAIMALNEPVEPWIFVAMQKDQTGTLQAVLGPTLDGKQFAQMLNFRGGAKVQPTPATNNQSPVITCRHASIKPPAEPLPIAQRKGVATAAFLNGNLNSRKVKEIVAIVADPAKSHFFNTDCVSCHTETAQPLRRRIPGFRVPGVATAVLPKSNYNVRNFGWFLADATATQRTARETAEVVTFINKNMLGQ